MTVAPAGLAAVPDDVEDAGVEGATQPEASPAIRAPARQSAPESTEDLARVRNVAVYLPVDLLERLKRTRRSRELTYADLLVEAAAAHLDELEAVFRTQPPQPSRSGMPVRSRRRAPEPSVQVQLRLDGYQLAWLEEQAGRLGAPSRSALVVGLLQAHLS
jgi:hypothetical protein